MAEFIATCAKKADDDVRRAQEYFKAAEATKTDDDGKRAQECSKQVVPQEELEVNIWFHLSMKIPFEINTDALRFKVKSNMTMLELTWEVEEFFQEHSADRGRALELDITTIWNMENREKAMLPCDNVNTHFVSGETFGVYGNVKTKDRDEHDEPTDSLVTYEPAVEKKTEANAKEEVKGDDEMKKTQGTFEDSLFSGNGNGVENLV